MLPPQQLTERVAFGLFEVDLSTAELFRKGRKIRLSCQPAQVLVILLQRAGQLVTREELRARLWPEETFVDFDHGLNNCINRIRDVLGDSAASPQCIETLPKRGYRFIAPVQTAKQVVHSHSALSAVAGATDVIERREGSALVHLAKGPRRVWVAVFAISVPVALIAVASMAVHSRNQHREGALAGVKAIAVLPFSNLSGDSSLDYLADGITDEVISELGRRTNIPVISTNSVKRYRNRQTALSVIARELDVDAVVQGRLQRTENQFAVAVRAIAVRTESTLWNATYRVDNTQVPQLASSIASGLGGQLGSPGGNSALPRRVQIVSSEAYEQYLKGQAVWNEGSSQAALGHFQRALELQPDYAAAYGGIAKSYCRMEFQQALPPAEAYPPASAAVQKALSLDPDNPDAHAALSYLYAQRDWDWDRAEQELKTAIADDPASYVGHRWYRYILHQKGRHREALQQARLSLKSDPASSYAQFLYAIELEDNDDYLGAIAAISEALELNASDPEGWEFLANAYGKTANPALAAENLEKAYRLYREPDIADRFHKRLPVIGYRLAAEAAQREHLLRELDRLKKKSAKGEYVSPSAYAFVYAGLHDRENTLKSLEAAYSSDSHVMTQLREHDFDFVRDDPRFRRIWELVPFSH